MTRIEQFRYAILRASPFVFHGLQCRIDFFGRHPYDKSEQVILNAGSAIRVGFIQILIKFVEHLAYRVLVALRLIIRVPYGVSLVDSRVSYLCSL